MLKYKYLNDDSVLEMGIDEAGRGPLLGRVYAAAVVLPPKDSFDETSAKTHVNNIKNSIVKINEPQEYVSGSSLNIHDFHDSYDSHSNNIKRVYLDETVIPIDESYHKSNPRNINSLDDIRRVRNQAFSPLTETESSRIMNERQNSHHLKSKKIAYDMYKRRELHEKKYTENISKYNLIGR